MLRSNSLPSQTKGALKHPISMAASELILGHKKMLFSIAVYHWFFQFSSVCKRQQRISYLSQSSSKFWMQNLLRSVLIVKYKLLSSFLQVSCYIFPINLKELSLSFMIILTTAQTWKSKHNFHSFKHHISLNFYVQQVLVTSRVFHFHFHFSCVHQQNFEEGKLN